MTGLIWILSITLMISGIFNIWACSACLRKDAQIRRLERDSRIGELERQLDMNLPALTSGFDAASPLMRLLAVVVGIWAADRYKLRDRRRW